MAKKRAKRFDEGGDVGIYDYASLGKRAPKASEKKDLDYAYDAISEITGKAEIDRANKDVSRHDFNTKIKTTRASSKKRI